MPKLIKKYSLGAGIPSAAFNFAAISSAVANQDFAPTIPNPSPLPPIDIDAGIPNSNSIDNSHINAVRADFANPNPRFAVDREIANKANNGGWDFDPTEIKRRQQETNYKNQLKGYGIQMMGRQLGESIGGDWGDVLGQTAGNFGDIIGNGGSLKDFTKASNLGNLGASIGTSVLDRHTAHSRYSGKHGDLAGGIDQVAGIIGNTPYASLGMAAINKVTGGTDGMTTQDALLGSNAVAGALFAVNPALGAAYMGVSALNSATGKTTQKFKGNDLESQEARAALGGSYGKTEGDLVAAQNRSGKKYGGISRLTGQYQRANRIVGEGNDYMASLNNIYDRRQLGQIRGQNMANSLDYRLNTFGGYDQYGTVIGRKGMKLPTNNEINRVRSLINNIEQFKKGGQMNVIPEGALHARLHHMETGNKITKKGIPVIDKHGEQQAEIERNEIIFSLEVTNKLEELRKDGSDKAALEAGKLLVDEIFNNTDDRTGLIQEVIGTDETKKGIFKEGGIIAEMPNFAIQAEEPEIEKFQDGGIIAEEPEMDSDEDEPIGIEEVEYFQTGGIIAEEPDGSDDDEVEEYQEGEKSKRKSKNLVIPNFLKYNESEDYYEPNLEFTYDKTWFNTEDGKKFLEKYQEEKTNNGASIKFTKRKKPLGGFGGEYQPTEDFFDGTEIMFNGIPVKPINEFEIDGQQKYVDQKGQTYTLQPVNQQYKNGGIIEQLNKLSPDKLKELENILKYLNHD